MTPSILLRKVPTPSATGSDGTVDAKDAWTRKVSEWFAPRGRFRAQVLAAMIRDRWFIRWRWIIAGGATLVLGLERWYGANYSRPLAVAGCVAALAAVNVVWLVAHQRIARAWGDDVFPPRGVLTRVVWFANAQMLVDLTLLTVLLRYSGGIENPIALFYLFHVFIAALILRSANAILQGLAALLLYSVVVFGECVDWLTPHYPFLFDDSILHQDARRALVGVGALGVAIAGSLICAFRISQRLEAQERELRHANEALIKSNDEIKAMQARRSRFMLTAAHQLKSPAAGIQTLAGLIRDGVATGEKIKDINQRIIQRCQDAIQQITELLTLERVEQHGLEDRIAVSTVLDGPLHKLIRRARESAPAQKLTVNLRAEGASNAYVPVDERDLEDCLGNLLDNAVKYTPEGGRVWVEVSREKDRVSVSIRDSGMGIAESSMDVLFEPFCRGETALAAGISGSGLGLAIVKAVVEQAGGDIRVRSEVGKGSEFIVTFPRVSPRITAPAASAPPLTGRTHPCSTES